MNKEHKNKINREYYHRNKDRINFKRRGGAKRQILTEEERKQKEKEYNDLYAARIKAQPHKVYLLVDYNYVGTTQSLTKRFAQHRYASGFDCTNYKILFESFDRNECLEFEKHLHDKGYNGRNKHASYR
jgi:predicted GIY-YIG superfamily endonuclease